MPTIKDKLKAEERNDQIAVNEFCHDVFEGCLDEHTDITVNHLHEIARALGVRVRDLFKE